MFGTHFYHQRIRRSVAVFGSLFNNIYVVRKDGNNQVTSQVKVPLSYGPKRKFLERIREQENLDGDTSVAIKLPRMSFEIIAFDYDATRQLSKTNNFNLASTLNTARNKFYAPTPYNINFQLNIMAKNQDDALQIVEQILPYFNPQYSLTIKPLDDFPTIKEDTPILLQGVNFSDDYEGILEQRRTMVYTLDFIMKINMYGPIRETEIVRSVETNLGFKQGGLADSDVIFETVTVTPDPSDAEPGDDFGFTTTIE